MRPINPLSITHDKHKGKTSIVKPSGGIIKQKGKVSVVKPKATIRKEQAKGSVSTAKAMDIRRRIVLSS